MWRSSGGRTCWRSWVRPERARARSSGGVASGAAGGLGDRALHSRRTQPGPTGPRDGSRDGRRRGRGPSLFRNERSGGGGRAVLALAGTHDQALVIVDQFEELFTLNSAEVQRALLSSAGAAGAEVDVRVLLTMRDDFLFRCSARGAEASLLRADPARSPGRSALRRALVQPATQVRLRLRGRRAGGRDAGRGGGRAGCAAAAGLRRVAAVGEAGPGARVCSPAQAYHEIGGVGGALARHAEETIERIGTEPGAARAGAVPQPGDGAGHARGAGG